MPNQKGHCEKCCIHWTAGGLTANDTDKEHYHYIAEWDGKIVTGKHHPQDNARTLIPASKNYARHCGGGNSWVLGVAVCGGNTGYKIGGKLSEFTEISLEAICKKVAEYFKFRKFKKEDMLNPMIIYTHAEFGLRNPKSSSAGKIDITDLPYEKGKSKTKPNQVGDKIRKLVYDSWDKIPLTPKRTPTLLG